MTKPYLGPSDSQANADALARRESSFGPEHRASVTVAYDYRRREPKDLGDAVRQVRYAFADEVPAKLHDGPDAIGEGGTPRMTVKAESYLFGDPRADDAGRNPETGQRDLMGYYRTPFRATLATMAASTRESHRRHAAIVQHVTLGQMTGPAAAIAEGVPYWCAGSVAELAIRTFLRNLSDMKIHPPRQDELVAEVVTAA